MSDKYENGYIPIEMLYNGEFEKLVEKENSKITNFLRNLGFNEYEIKSIIKR